MGTARIPLTKHAEYDPRTIPNQGECHYIGEDNQYCARKINRAETYCEEHRGRIYMKKRVE